MDDSDLLERLRLSDEEAFRLLFERYQPILFRSVLYSLRESDSAHDVVQETFVRVWTHRSSLQPDLPLLGYLFRVSRNLVRDAMKHAEVRKRLEGEILPALFPREESPEESAHRSMLEEELAEVVRTKLPAKCREIFLLSRMEGMSNAEISKHLSIEVKTVENQISRGMKILRRHLRWYREKK